MEWAEGFLDRIYKINRISRRALVFEFCKFCQFCLTDRGCWFNFQQPPGLRLRRLAVLIPRMKSAYELAMDRLKAAEPETTTKLTAEQKKQLAEVDTRYKAKLAEREIFLQQQITAARMEGQAEEYEKLREQLRRERTRLAEDCEDEKNRVRKKY